MREVDQLIQTARDVISPDLAPETIVIHYPAAVASADRDDGTMRPFYLSESYAHLFQLSDEIFMAQDAGANQIQRLGYMAFNDGIARAFAQLMPALRGEEFVKAAVAVSGLRLNMKIGNKRTFLVAGPERLMSACDIAIPTNMSQRIASLSIAMQRDITDDKFYSANVAALTEELMALAYQGALNAAKNSPVGNMIRYRFDDADYNALGMPAVPTRTVLHRLDQFSLRDEDVTTFSAQLAASMYTLADTAAFNNVMIPHPCGLPQVIRIIDGTAYRSILYPVLHGTLRDMIECPKSI